MHLTDLELIRKSRYFDAGWYATRYPDTKDIDQHQHYLTYGWKEERLPSLSFNGPRYLAAYPDLAKAKVNPLVHFLRTGIAEKRWAGIAHEVSEWMSQASLACHATQADTALVRASDLFDADWYRLMYGYCFDTEADPAAHYLAVGASAGLSPSPRFNGPAYAMHHSDVGEGNPLLHYLKQGRSKGYPRGISAAQQSLLACAMATLAPLEPDLTTENRFYQQKTDLIVNDSLQHSALSAAWKRIYLSLDERVKHLVAIPWLVRGGADLAAMNVLRALQEQHGKDSVALLITDHQRIDAIDWVPEGSRVIRFTEDDDTSPLLGEQRIKLLETVLWTFRPQQIFNVNSAACWKAYAKSGKALAGMTSLRALLFCRDYSDDQRAVGYSDTHLRPSLPYLDRMYFDTLSFQKDIANQYGLPAPYIERMTFLPQPFDFALAPAPASLASTGGRPRVLWVGRLCFQKNTELLDKIMASAQHFDFDIYGTGTPEKEMEMRERCLASNNASFLGSFSKLNEIDLGKYTAYLFTSRYEGMPTILLNIAATQLPIVASAVGGVPELIDAETGWAIADIEHPGPYIDALEQIVKDPQAVVQRTQSLLQKLRSRHAWDVFKDALLNPQ